MSRPPHQSSSTARSTTQGGQRSSYDASGRPSSQAPSSNRHASRKPTRPDRRASAQASLSDYEDVYKSRQPSILKKQKYFEEDDYFNQKKQRQAPIYRQPDLLPQKIPRDPSKPRSTRHATFHESTNDPNKARRSNQPPQPPGQKSRVQKGSSFKSLSEWRKSVANLLDKSQLSAVDRFRRRTLAFRTAVCIGLILATAAVVAAIMGTVYYVRVHKAPLAKPKVFMLASINGTLRLLDMTFNPVLENRQSGAFQQLEQAICATIRDAVADSSSCSVSKFRNGSVIADFQFKVNLPSLDADATGNTGHMPNRRDEIMTNVTSQRLSKIGHKFNLFIDPEFKRQPEVDLFMSEIRTQKIVRIAAIEQVVNNKEVEIICTENTTTSTTNYFPDRSDCRAFLVCDGSQLYRMTCGEGTAWNDEEITCDFKSKTNCSMDSDSAEFEGDEIDLPNEEAEDSLKVVVDRSKAEAKRKLKGIVERISTTTTTTTTTTEPMIRLSKQSEGKHYRYRSTFDEANPAPAPATRRGSVSGMYEDEAMAHEESELLSKLTKADEPAVVVTSSVKKNGAEAAKQLSSSSKAKLEENEGGALKTSEKSSSRSTKVVVEQDLADDFVQVRRILRPVQTTPEPTPAPRYRPTTQPVEAAAEAPPKLTGLARIKQKIEQAALTTEAPPAPIRQGRRVASPSKFFN